MDTLIWLRWLAIVGQTAAILTAHYALGLQFPVLACFVCVAASVVVNAGLRVRFPVSHRLDDSWAIYVLAYDVAQLAALLALSGGLANPFSFLFLAPIMTAAVALPLRRTLTLLAFTLACATALQFWRVTLRWPDGAAFEPPPLYVVGMWISIAVSGAFIAIYGSRIAEEARQLTSALTATELTLARQQHLSQLDGIAAAAAHELGTPLATVALVVHDLAAQPQIAAQWADDLRLVEEQVARCRTILRKLSSPDTIAAASMEETTLGDLIEEIVAPHRLLDVAIEVESQGTPPEPICRRNAGLIYGLHNIVENAVSFAERRVAGQRLLDRFRGEDRHRRRRPRFPAPRARAARRALYFHPRRRGAAARGRGGRRPGAWPVHRQGAARKIRRGAGNRQLAAAGVRRRGDDRLADRKVRTGSTTASTGVRELGLWPTATRQPNPKETPSARRPLSRRRSTKHC